MYRPHRLHCCATVLWSVKFLEGRAITGPLGAVGFSWKNAVGSTGVHFHAEERVDVSACLAWVLQDSCAIGCSWRPHPVCGYWKTLSDMWRVLIGLSRQNWSSKGLKNICRGLGAASLFSADVRAGELPCCHTQCWGAHEVWRVGVILLTTCHVNKYIPLLYFSF